MKNRFLNVLRILIIFLSCYFLISCSYLRYLSYLKCLDNWKCIFLKILLIILVDIFFLWITGCFKVCRLNNQGKLFNRKKEFILFIIKKNFKILILIGTILMLINAGEIVSRIDEDTARTILKSIFLNVFAVSFLLAINELIKIKLSIPE